MINLTDTELLRSNSQPLASHVNLDDIKATWDKVDLHVLWRDTQLNLSVWQRRVLEGKDLMQAVEFARFIRNSGLLKLFRCNPQAAPFRVDAGDTAKALDDLLYHAGERLRNAKSGQVDLSVVESIDRKLDLIAGYVAKLVPAPQQSAQPTLKVISNDD